jgi:hypothetical protein
LPDLRINLLNGGNQVNEKTDWVVITVIQGEPSKRFARFRCLDPFADDGCLPKPGWRTNECDAFFSLVSIFEVLYEPWTPNKAGLNRWDVELRR